MRLSLQFEMNDDFTLEMADEITARRELEKKRFDDSVECQVERLTVARPITHDEAIDASEEAG